MFLILYIIKSGVNVIKFAADAMEAERNKVLKQFKILDFQKHGRDYTFCSLGKPSLTTKVICNNIKIKNLTQSPTQSFT